MGGFAHLGRDRRLLTLFLLMACFGLAGMGYSAMIPAYARLVVRTDVGGYSVLLACSGVGATGGALAVASLGGLRSRDKLVLTGLFLFAAFLAAAAFVPPLFGGSGRARLLAGSVCLLGVGFGAVVFYSAAQTMIQTAVPDHLRGRRDGGLDDRLLGVGPGGGCWTGRAAQSYGVAPVMGVSAGLCALVGLAVWCAGGLPAGRGDSRPASRVSEVRQGC